MDAIKKIDLHTHSSASDGLYSPSGLIDRAVENGLIRMALTDHDTVDGLAEGIGHAASLGFDLVPGIEFSVDFRGGTFHLVGLHIDHLHGELVDETARLKAIREKRVYGIIDDLAAHGIPIDVSEVQEIAGDASFGRPHIARVLVKRGYAADVEEVFRNFLVKGKPGYVKKEKISLDGAFRLIGVSGGMPVLAHPVSMNLESPAAYASHISELKRKGLAGIEVYAGMHDASAVNLFRRIALEQKLLVSGGSDFHGDKRERLGYYGNELVPLDDVDIP